MNVPGNLAKGHPQIRPQPPMGPWIDQAACTGLNPDLFHPARGEPSDAAKTVCAGCPVRSDCLDFALRTNQQFGIWGGLSERARCHIRLTDPDLVTLDLECPCCGATFRARRAGQRFCSPDCRNYHRTAWSRR